MPSVFQYDLLDYGQMVADRGRMEPYVEALRRTVRKDSVVLDLGAGLGVFAMLAARFGARCVYAVEPNDVVQVARDVARANDCADQIQFFQMTSDQLTLPEPATIIVSDLRGALPLYEYHLPAIIDARRRLLAPEGILIPKRDRVLVALVEAPETHQRYADPWESGKDGLDFSPALRLVRNSWYVGKLNDARLLTEAETWATLEYERIDSADVSGTVGLTATDAGTAHGFALWFETTLVPGVEFDNRPPSSELVYPHAFFPLETPLAIASGDVLRITLDATLSGNTYVWRWESAFFEAVDLSNPRRRFSQSTFFGRPLSLERLRQGSADYVPELREEGEMDLLILKALTSGSSLGATAAKLALAFPHQFPSDRQALPHVVRLAERYASATPT
jgi:SAM-dependent methyltransferase